MGNTCFSDSQDQFRTQNRIQFVFKPLSITATENSKEPFGQKILSHYIHLSPQVLESLKKYGLYRFEFSVADLRGTEDLPVKLAKSDDMTYVGQMLGNMMHGKAHLLTSNGDFFVCPFFEGQPRGEGAVYFANGDYFIGRLIMGDLEDGKMFYRDRTVYAGQFLNKKRHGKGVYTYSDGTKYDGYWSNDTEHGQGKLIICGVWRNGTRLSTLEAKYFPATPISTSAIGSPTLQSENPKKLGTIQKQSEFQTSESRFEKTESKHPMFPRN